MNLLNTILLYLTMIFVSSVQSAPEPSLVPETPTPAPTAIAATATPTAAPTPTPTPVPTPAITPNNAYKTLKVGDKGENVKLLQRRLAELGYYTGDVDGVFGNQTRRSVERFQYYQGLSVDGIAGKRTQTVLYESSEVVYAPVDVTPSPTPRTTAGPTAALTSAPPTSTPAPTFVPAPTATPTPSAAQAAAAASDAPVSALTADTATDEQALLSGAAVTVPQTTLLPETASGSETAQPAGEATAEPTAATSPDTADSVSPAPSDSATPSPEEAIPTLREDLVFVLAGHTEPLVWTTDQLPADAEPVVLHPLMVGEQAYLPMLEILRDAGVVLVPGANSDTAFETAFSVLTHVYQLSATVDANGVLSNLSVADNGVPMLLSRRDGYLLDGIVYLPAEVCTEMTGLTFAPDEATGVYTVVMPAQTEN